MVFLIEIRIRNVVSVLTYGISFLRHMTSYMMYFVKWSIFDWLTPNLVQWCVLVPQRSQNKLFSDRGHNVDVMSVLWPIMSKLEFDISSYHISETRLDTHYMFWTPKHHSSLSYHMLSIWKFCPFTTLVKTLNTYGVMVSSLKQLTVICQCHRDGTLGFKVTSISKTQPQFFV